MGAQTDFIIPLNIYFKPDITGTATQVTITKSDSPKKIIKAVRFVVRPDNMSRDFEFKLVFNLKRHKQYTDNKINTIIYNKATIKSKRRNELF